PENRPLSDRARAENVALKQQRAARRGAPLPVWYQLDVTTATAEIVPPTRTGDRPFDEDVEGKSRCPRGDLIGLNLLSEVSVRADTRGDTDIACSRQFIGARQTIPGRSGRHFGVFRAVPVILISPKFREMLVRENVKGAYTEVVHLV
ncbi:MAG: hypothetical protein ACRETG_13435, partial [Steroidobacteraceae bacterium]